MSPVVLTLLCLCVLYVIGREVEHYERNGRMLTPSKCEHFVPDEEFDSWVEIWEAAYAEDELEVWASLPVYDRGIHSA